MSLSFPLLSRTLRWCLVGTVAAFIGYWSLVTTPPAIVPLLASPISIGGTLTTSGFSGEVPQSSVRHAIAYATLTVTLAYALADREAPIAWKVLLVFAAAMGYGAVLEFGQLFHADRVASLTDVTINAAGVAAALHWYALERRVEFVHLGRTDRYDRSASQH